MLHMPDIFFGHGKFNDFEYMAQSVLGWDLEIFQLEPGKFQGEALQLGNRDFMLSTGWFSHRTEQRGGQPPYSRNMVLTADHGTQVVYRKQQIPANGLMVFPQGAEVDSIAGDNTRLITVSFNDSLLEEAARSLGRRDLSKTLDRDDWFAVDPQALDRLRSRLRRIGRLLDRGDSAAAGAAMLPELQAELPRQLLKMLAGKLGPKGRPEGKVLKRAMARAKEYLRENPQEPVSVQELCRRISASERTLQYGFKRRFGVSPKQYLMARRLNGVRKDLLATAEGPKLVSEAAMRWGFWHLSQFAQDYRRLFGELPSQTLGRARGA